MYYDYNYLFKTSLILLMSSTCIERVGSICSIHIACIRLNSMKLVGLGDIDEAQSKKPFCKRLSFKTLQFDVTNSKRRQIYKRPTIES